MHSYHARKIQLEHIDVRHALAASPAIPIPRTFPHILTFYSLFYGPSYDLHLRSGEVSQLLLSCWQPFSSADQYRGLTLVQMVLERPERRCSSGSWQHDCCGSLRA
jgi:hypothetical protein